MTILQSIGAKGFGFSQMALKRQMKMHGSSDGLRPQVWHDAVANKLKQNDRLPYDSYKFIDDVVSDAIKPALVLVRDLAASGFVQNIDNLGQTFVQWESRGATPEAIQSMGLKTKGDNHRIKVTQNLLPIPITHADFEMDAREFMAGENAVQTMDTSMIAEDSYQVGRKIESVAWAGNDSMTVNGSDLPGIIDHPNRITGTMDAAWLNLARTTLDIDKAVLDVTSMKQDLVDAGYQAPYRLYVPSAYGAALDSDTSTSYQETLKDRLLKIDGIEAVEIAFELPDTNTTGFTVDTICLIAWNATNIDLVSGSDIVTIPYEEPGGFSMNWKILAAQIMRIKPRYPKDSDTLTAGVVTYTKAAA